MYGYLKLYVSQIPEWLFICVHGRIFLQMAAPPVEPRELVEG
jgi:hypothetical protein